MRRPRAPGARLLTLAALALAAISPFQEAPLLAEEAAPPGARPGYMAKPLSAVPNARAITRRFWAPGLDEGYTPQGLVVARGRVHVVGYRGDGCRLFGFSPGGTARGSLAVPGCRHGGGLAALADGRLVVIDTRGLHVVSGGRVTARIALEKPLTGSFGDFDGRDLWIGSYERGGPGRLWRIPVARLAQARLTEADAAASIAIPARAQGMAFAGATLWLTFSGSSFGRISRIDRKTGAEIAGYDMPAGIEDIGVDSAGLIWAVSEAGAKKYANWGTNFPLVFTIDPGRLQ